MINHHSSLREAQMLQSLHSQLKSQETYVQCEVMQPSKASRDKCADSDQWKDLDHFCQRERESVRMCGIHVGTDLRLKKDFMIVVK